MKGPDLADGQLMALPRVPDVEANGDLRARADEGSGITPELLAGLRQAVERARSRPGAEQRALLGPAEDPHGGQTPARAGTMTQEMPSASASPHACSGPAPPK